MPDFDPSKLIDPLKDERNDVHLYRSSDILSYIVNRYIETYDDFVFKDGAGKYVFAKTMSDTNIKSVFSLFFTELMNSDKFVMGDKKTFIVSGGFPFMNWRNADFTSIESPSSRKIIKMQLLLNYVMTDRQIKMDESHLCNVWNSWFFSFMSDQKQLNELVGIYDNVYFMCNKHTSEDDCIVGVTELFGPTRCTLKNLEIVKSINELNQYVYTDLPDVDIPVKVKMEILQYINMILKKPEN